MPRPIRLTAHFGIAHGHAVGMMLPHVVRFNAHDPDAARVYGELAAAAHLAPPDEPPEAAADCLATYLERLMDFAGLGRSLAALGVQERVLPGLAAEAAFQWTAQFNPRPATVLDFERLYAGALNPGATRS